MTDLIPIAGDRLSAAINPFGAELTHLRDADGRELMTDADPAYWPRHAPLLFPVVGRPYRDTIRVDGREYPMGQHGFARDRAFVVSHAAADRAVFTLRDDEETHRRYPFAFELEVGYAVAGATLSIDVAVRNPGETPLPASFGFHPAFAWPLPYGRPRAEHRIVFTADETSELRAIADDGTIARGTRPSPLHGRVLPLADELFAHDALVWDPVASSSLTYGAASGPRLRVDFPDTPCLGIWSKPGAGFVCVEPWHGIADPEGFTGDIRAKPQVFVVPGGAEKRIGMRVTLID